MRPPVRAVFFDLDDTLCNYMQAADAARRWVFHLVSGEYQGLTADDLIEAWLDEFDKLLPEVRADGPWRSQYLVSGRPTRTELMRRVLRRLEIEDQHLAGRMSEAYNHERVARLELLPGAEEALASLGDRVPLGVITNGPADTQREEIAKLGIGHRFQTTLIEGEFGIGKPHPAIFRAAADSIPVRLEEAMFVGNSLEQDVRGARRAGLQTCWIAAGGGDPREADCVVRDLIEAAQCIEARLSVPEQA
jgi:putative hydrolase of the HAD superfamily